LGGTYLWGGRSLTKIKGWKDSDDREQNFTWLRPNAPVARSDPAVVANLGRLEQLQERDLDNIIEGLMRYSKKHRAKKDCDGLAISGRDARTWGPALVFRRLWESMGLSWAINSLVDGSQIEYRVDEAAFAMVLHRLEDPGSKRKLYRHWLKTVQRPEFEGLELHHFYRTLDVLAQHKGRIESSLFQQAMGLFGIDLDFILWDTTSTYFEGDGPEEIGACGLSKDHRPDRVQVMVGVLMTRDGYPVAHEIFPGSTADANTFRALLKETLKRFPVKRCILVGDRGMMSKDAVRELEESGLEYILGLRMRRDKDGDRVLKARGRYRKVEESLHVKDISLDGKRYVLCFNPIEAEHQRRIREIVVFQLKQQLQKDIKSLVKNRQYRRFLRVKDKKQITMDENAIKSEARYDGKWILKTNTSLSAAEVAMAYKSLWQVERAFREMKSSLELRPIYHWSESRVRGHIMVCFLAFVLESALMRSLKASGREDISIRDLMADLKRLQAMRISVEGEEYLVRTEFQGKAYEAFKVLGLRPRRRSSPF